MAATGVSLYSEKATSVMRYERPVPTYVEMLNAEIAMSNPHDLLPDLVPLPPRNLTLEDAANGNLRLLFSTTYYNQGRGPLELQADPTTSGVADDLERAVYQRVYDADGSHTDNLVGTFSWHQSHRHYHFADFVSYVLTDESSGGHPIVLHKATFCIRDVSRLKSDGKSTKASATYSVCGRERQGVSVGWGDTYYYNYPDQLIDLTSIPSGVYRLTFIVNPGGRLRELAYLNNRSYVVFALDKEKRRLIVQKQFPENPPEIEHIHLDDPFGL